MIIYRKTNADDKDFKQLNMLLEADLRNRDGDEYELYAAINKIDKLQHVLIAYENDLAIGCGAIRQYDTSLVEVKRMYVQPVARGKGIASAILQRLEKWATEMHYKKCWLETGDNQPEAIALYNKNGYRIIPKFGQYKNSEHSICFEKILADNS